MSGSVVNPFNQRLHGCPKPAADWARRNSRVRGRGIRCHAERQAAAIVRLLGTDSETADLHRVARQFFFKRRAMDVEVFPQIDQ